MAQAIERIHADDTSRYSRSWDQSEAETAALHRRLTEDYGNLSEQDMLAALTEEEFPGRSAVIASFGTESAVLLDIVASVNKHLPVLFIDTCLLYTSDAADEEDSVDLGGRRIIKKKKRR
eukprot:TRINITY_DN11414_c0_g2_i1.p1 TRINITY_DN11414_c0_g2~~TRINITY_DN11414_c0_g2_i1.p1  ORF type:complete len:120 (+),score=23.42 TRINITY_DN11414_c0_g2_i1:434-793(+)